MSLPLNLNTMLVKIMTSTIDKLRLEFIEKHPELIIRSTCWEVMYECQNCLELIHPTDPAINLRSYNNIQIKYSKKPLVINLRVKVVVLQHQ